VAINFIPNDPLANVPPLRRKAPRANRPAGRATFQLFAPAPESLASPGTPEFLFWQCREGALAAVAAWEGVAGPLTRWQGDRARLNLVQDAVVILGKAPTPNAFYDRASFQFFQVTTNGVTTFSGASTDVVAHEVGHGLLDTIRPDLWDTPFLEVGAFHEAFGDCMALLTAFDDLRSRTALRAIAGRLDSRNFVETTAEDLSLAIRRIQPNHNAAEPRRALNQLVWQLPSTLPFDGGPGALINEAHSFARVFSGCFYDLIRNLLAGAGSDAALRAAVRKAATLLIAGTRQAPQVPRFFQAVGRAMTAADQQLNAGANHDAIRNAFAAHGVALGTNAMDAPLAELAGPSPQVNARGASLPAATARDLRSRLGISAASMTVHAMDLPGGRVAEARYHREVDLGHVHKSLKGCVAIVPQSVMVGESGGRAAVLGLMPETRAIDDETSSFVESLLKHNRIAFGGKPQTHRTGLETHVIRARRGGKKILARAGFMCGA
jgi:hypothetical protein